MAVTLSITVDDDLDRDLAEAVSGRNRSALVAQARDSAATASRYRWRRNDRFVPDSVR